MKVVCGSCGAKYSVADDKVAGKTVKIRCKKCSETIVVRGDQGGFDEDEATRVFDYGAEAVWHVVVNGEQQGPFAPPQIGGLISEGKVDAEAYVWKEGFDGWKPLKEVPELAPFAKGGADATAVEADVEADAPAGNAGADLFSGGSKGDAGADLFSGTSKSSAFAAPEDDDGVVASKASPRVTAQDAQMTGQRNENSVLFSLSNLQALASSPKPSGPSPSVASAPTPAAKPAGHAVGEASGLIDIRALASATAAKPAASSGGGGSANIDDLLSMGGASPLAGGLASPLLAPPPAARSRDDDDDDDAPKKSKGSNTGLLIGGGVVLLLLLVAVGGLAYKVMTHQPQVVTVVQQVGAGDGDRGGSNSDSPPGSAGGDTAPAGGGSESAAAGTTGTASTTGTTGRTGTTGTTGRTGTTGTTGRTGTTGTATTGTAATTGTPAREETRTTGGTTGAVDPAQRMREMLSMTGSTTGGTTTMTGGATGGAETGGGAGATPTRAQISAALGPLAGQVRACGGPAGEVASVAVVFASNGSVRSASVGGSLAGTPAAGCIARVVRGAHVPAFTNPSFSVTYPYRL